MVKNESYYEKMMKVFDNPPKPVKPTVEDYKEDIAFPDKDATKEEIKEYLNK